MSTALRINPSELIDQAAARFLPITTDKEPPPVGKERATLALRVKRDGWVYQGYARRKGDLVDVPVDQVGALVGRGEVDRPILVRALHKGVLIGNRVMTEGETANIQSEERAKELYRVGWIEILNAAECQISLPERAIGRALPRQDINLTGKADEPKEKLVRIRAKIDGVYAGTRRLCAGDVGVTTETLAGVIGWAAEIVSYDTASTSGGQILSKEDRHRYYCPEPRCAARSPKVKVKALADNVPVNGRIYGKGDEFEVTRDQYANLAAPTRPSHLTGPAGTSPCLVKLIDDSNDA
jgi:hypothetical protein